MLTCKKNKNISTFVYFCKRQSHKITIIQLITFKQSVATMINPACFLPECFEALFRFVNISCRTFAITSFQIFILNFNKFYFTNLSTSPLCTPALSILFFKWKTSSCNGAIKALKALNQGTECTEFKNNQSTESRNNQSTESIETRWKYWTK